MSFLDKQYAENTIKRHIRGNQPFPGKVMQLFGEKFTKWKIKQSSKITAVDIREN